ncbi:hypothetical protein [uncultured Streptococcus sp.]|uniref:hypothetical protein n=1 Tax=uncultured Streptococcus sp. TaxID=83427 RepID=UPI0025961A0C|nr:hypothetical protein [uncultured Streptococcus sp.]
MTHLQKLIEQEFNQIKAETRPEQDIRSILELQKEKTELKKEIAYLAPYQRLLEEPLYGWLLHGRIKIEELPLEVRMDSSAYIYAWRYAVAKHDADYGMAILDLFQSDMTELVRLEKLDQEAYGEYLEQWMLYLARGLSAFKDSKDYDQYFLKLQEAHKELFAEYIGDMEDNRDWVSLL